jgi:hypothetical protein
MSEVDQKNLDTPMMRQFLEIKKQYPDDILFFRMGDFYEMFLEDAVYASRVLDIALTRRQDKVPMCGVPYHSMSQYVHPILEQGRRIAICEQLEDPAEAQGRIVAPRRDPHSDARQSLRRVADRRQRFAPALRRHEAAKRTGSWRSLKSPPGKSGSTAKTTRPSVRRSPRSAFASGSRPTPRRSTPPAAGILQTRRYPIE